MRKLWKAPTRGVHIGQRKTGDIVPNKARTDHFSRPKYTASPLIHVSIDTELKQKVPKYSSYSTWINDSSYWEPKSD